MKNRTLIPLLLAACIAPATLATNHVVTQSGFTFSPSTINARPGDTIQWVRTGGSHTVTSGSACTANGIFSGVLNSTSTTFTWVVPASAANSTIPYFCNPHCLSGMTASIVVGPPVNPADLNGDGAVNAQDLATLLGGWGAPGPADFNQSGTVDASDLATLLGAWTG